MKKIKQLILPIPSETYAPYPPGMRKALSQIANATQAFIYLTISKFIITLFFLLHALGTCEVSESHSIASTLLIYEGFSLLHQSNYKKEIMNIDKLNQISLQLDQQGIIQQPDRYQLSQLIMTLKKCILALTPELHRESKYLILFAQVIIIRFIVVLTLYPFNYNIFRYFAGVCDQALLNVIFVMVIPIFLEYVVIYFFVIALIVALPVLGCLYLFRRAQKAYSLYKVKRYFSSFPIHKYTGLEDIWATEDRTCCICMQEYQNEDTLLKLPCSGNHIFHELCIRDWLKISTECPLCRQKLQ